MKISELLKKPSPSFSFEFFPPKTDDDVAQLMQTAASLRVLKPTFISVTWGAGGSTRRRTIDIVCSIKNALGVEAAAHLTCVGAAAADVDAVLEELDRRGVENVVALRGDPPRNQPHFVPHPDGFRYAGELVAHIRKRWDFCLAVAGYPEGHPECPDKAKDLDHLKRKADAGADLVITQLFFDNADYFNFVDRARAAGIRLPIIPGIMPVTNVGQIKRFTTLCGAKIPLALLRGLERVEHDKEAVIQAGIDHATRQCEELLARGAPGVHFYTLNRSRSTAEILKNVRGT
jgi:methylenetetrahydrofolate reductase (NADPH)